MTLVTGPRKDSAARCNRVACNIVRRGIVIRVHCMGVVTCLLAGAFHRCRCTKEIRADYAAIAAVDDRLLRRRFRHSAPAWLQRIQPTPCACSCLMAARDEHACDTLHLHVAHQLPANPCSPLSNTRGGFAAGAWRLRRPVPQLW